MILVDTSIWIDHIRKPDSDLVALLVQGQVRQHRFVTSEIALGSLANREALIGQLNTLPQAAEVSFEAFLDFVEHSKLAAKGIGFVDAYLLAATAHMQGGRLWTRDKRLHLQAERLGIAYSPA